MSIFVKLSCESCGDIFEKEIKHGGEILNLCNCCKLCNCCEIAMGLVEDEFEETEQSRILSGIERGII